MRNDVSRGGMVGWLVAVAVWAGVGGPGHAAEPDRAAERRRALALQFDGGNRYAVVIGINDYDQPQLDGLKACVPDAKLMVDVLTKKCGYKAENVLILTDGNPPERRPTKHNFQRLIPEMLARTAPGDTVLVYFAGHGAVVRGQSALMPADADVKNMIGSNFRVDELRDMLHESKASQKLLILDACHSGGVKNGGVALGFTGDDIADQKNQAKAVGGLITFTGCRKSQTSIESPRIGHGIFTYCLARGLAGEADFDKDGVVDSDEVYRHLYAEVSGMAKEMDHVQQPVRIIGEDVIGLFALARVSGEPLALPKPAGPAAPAATFKVGEVVTNSLGMKFAVVPPGTFTWGSPGSEAGRDEDEDQATVVIPRGMLVGAHEVTQRQFAAVMGKNPSYFAKGGEGAAQVGATDTTDFPVEQVTWAEADEFCKKLSALPDEQKAGRVYRLPTEGEWEYACRAGTATAFAFGDLLSPKDANVDGERPYLNSPDGPSLKRPAPVGSYKANAWGLHDVHGNVWEWCADWYMAKPGKAVTLGGPGTGAQRVMHSGAYSGDVALARCASRRDRDPDFRHRTCGFRVVFQFAAPTAAGN